MTQAAKRRGLSVIPGEEREILDNQVNASLEGIRDAHLTETSSSGIRAADIWKASRLPRGISERPF